MTSRYRFVRWLVMIVSVVNVLAAALTLLVINDAANSGAPLPARIGSSMFIGSSLLVAAVTFLIAWKAGDQPGNLIIALALAFSGLNSIAGLLLKYLHASPLIRQAVNLPTFILGAVFFVLAAARFARKLTPTDIASSSTIWGKIRLLRTVMIFFLAPAAVWALVAIPAVAMEFIDSGIPASIHWFTIVLLALVYFYINYRSGDAETRKKVLWFFELTLALFVINLVRHGVLAVLPDHTSETVHAIITTVYFAAYSISLVFCTCMAVFYAGAISPALVIRKTFVYGVTMALLLFTYATVESFITNVLVDKLGVSNGFPGALLGTVLALAFHPIRKWIENALKGFGSGAAPEVSGHKTAVS